MSNIFSINFGTKRVYGLDILRAVAIIFVITAHGAKILPQRFWHLHDVFLLDGVFLFFVLSGFLIGGILIKILERNKASLKNLREFWVRRWFRTIPNYFLILTILVAIRYMFYDGSPGIDVWKYYLFIQNFSSPHPLFFSEAWTLSVEEWFYIIIPMSVFVLSGIFKTRPKKAILITAAAIIVASIALRFHIYEANPPASAAEWDSHFRKEVVTRLDSLMFGVLGAYIAYYYKEIWIRHKKVLFWLGLAILIGQQTFNNLMASHVAEPGYGLYISVFSFSIMAIGVFLLLPWLSEYKSGKGKVYKSLTVISIASYSIYLIHVSLVQPFVFNITGGDALAHPSHALIIVRYLLYWTITIAGSILLYKFFEAPTTGLRDKFVRKNHQTPV